MIISAFNDENLESVLFDALEDQSIEYQESGDTHLGQSWEVEQLPRIYGYVWQESVMFGVPRHLLQPVPVSERDMLQIVQGLEFAKSSVHGNTADFPISFNEVCKLPFVQRIQRGWITLKAVWDAPDGNTYIFRLGLSGTQGYSYISK